MMPKKIESKTVTKDMEDVRRPGDPTDYVVRLQRFESGLARLLRPRKKSQRRGPRERGPNKALVDRD
jgi:hypothetical protein